MSKIENVKLVGKCPQLKDATLILAFSGWMDGGDVSTGTVTRIIELTNAEAFAEIEREPFYIYNFPGPMEVSALFRPHLKINEGRIADIEFPKNEFLYAPSSNLVFFVGKEPNLKWESFARSLFELAQQIGISKVLFVGSFGGAIPHTREPRLYVTCSNDELLSQMQRYVNQRTEYEGPGSFSSYLMTLASQWNMEMASIVAEIPGYLQGPNPLSIEAVTRRLATILKLKLDLNALRAASTEWELEVSNAVEENQELSLQVRKLEEEYDDQLLQQDTEF